MKKLPVILLLIIVLVQYIKAQPNDSLTNAKLALDYYEKAKKFAEAADDSLAIVSYTQALNYYKLATDSNAVARVSHNMGICYYNRNDFFSALKKHEEALKLFQAMNNQAGEAQAINSIGVIYLAMSNFPEALKQFFKSLSIGEAQQNISVMANAYMNIGLVYDNMRQSEKALEYHKKALVAADQLNNDRTIANCYNNMANAYSALGNYPMAISCYQQALSINNRINNKFGIASNLSNIGIVHFRNGDLQKAFEFLNQSIPVYNQIDDKGNIALAYEYLGEIVYNAPDSVLRILNIPSAIRDQQIKAYWKAGMDLFKEAGDIAGEADIHQLLSEMFEKEKNFANSLEHYKKYIVLRDSVLNNDKLNEITRQEMQFQFEKKEALAAAEFEKQQALSKAELKNQKLKNNTMTGAALFLLLTGAGGFISYKRRRDSLQRKKDAELLAEIANTEMKALRAQMNPHFIFNSLNAINYYIDWNDKQGATLFTTKFAKLMRMILENSEKREVTVAEDVRALQLYMELEALRLRNKFSFEISVDDEIDKDTTLIPPLILQPFVENSIWHGIAKKEGGGHIKVVIEKNSEMILCSVTDNGVGRRLNLVQEQDGSSQQRKSFGMKITQARIDLLNKIKKANASLQVTDLDQGLRIDIMLPYQTQF